MVWLFLIAIGLCMFPIACATSKKSVMHSLHLSSIEHTRTFSASCFTMTSGVCLFVVSFVHSMSPWRSIVPRFRFIAILVPDAVSVRYLLFAISALVMYAVSYLLFL